MPLTAFDAALQRASMRAQAQRMVQPQSADTSLLTRFGVLPLADRFFFEVRDGRVEAYPAEMVEWQYRDEPKQCRAPGCEVEASQQEEYCAFHEMQMDAGALTDGNAANEGVPMRDRAGGAREWDGFALTSNPA